MGIELARAFISVGVNSAKVKPELKSIESQLSEIGVTASVMGGLVTAAFGASAKSAVMAAGKYEQTMIAFSTMMGSVERAAGLLSDLTKFAAETPFEMPEIEQVARGMVMFGEDSKSLMSTLKMLGNAASGTSSSFGMLGLIYNQIRGVGKLLTQDFRQLSTRGVISLRDIAKHYKITDAAAQEMISRGKISFTEFREIMMGLAGEKGTGRFAGMMKKQSESMLGLLSTFSDAWRITMRQVGEELVPVAKYFVKLGIDTISSFSSMDSATKKLIAGTLGLGTVLGGLFTVMTTGAFTTSKLISAYTSTTEILSRYAQVSRAAALAQGSLNVAWASTPYLLAAIAAAAAIVVGYKIGQWLADQSEEAKEANRVLGELKEQIDGISEIDFKGTKKEDLEQYIEGMESLIEKFKQHNRELESQQSLWNLWGKNKDLIDVNNKAIQKFGLMAEKAKEEWEGMLAGEGGPKLADQIEEADSEMRRLANDVAGYQNRLREAQGEMEASKWRGAAWRGAKPSPESIAAVADYEDKLNKTRDALSNVTERLVAFRQAQAKVEEETDVKATEKIKDKTKALREQVDMYGMTATEVAFEKARREGVTDTKVLAEYGEALEDVEKLGREDIEKARGEEVWKTLDGYRKQVEAIGKSKDELLLMQMEEERFKDGLKYTKEELRKIAELLKNVRLAKAKESMTSPADLLQRQFDQLKKQYGETTKDYSTVARSMSKPLIDSLRPMKELGDQVAELDVRLKNNGITQEEYRIKLDKLVRGFSGAVDPVFELEQTISGLAMEFGEGSNSYNVFLQKLGQSTRDALNPFKQLEDEVKRLQLLMDKGAITREEYDKSIENLGRSVTESVNPHAALKTKIAELDVLLKAGAITQQTYNKAVWEAKRAIDSLTGTSGFVEFGQKIQDMLMKEAPGNLFPRVSRAGLGGFEPGTVSMTDADRQRIFAEGMEEIDFSKPPNINFNEIPNLPFGQSQPLSMDEVVRGMKEIDFSKPPNINFDPNLPFGQSQPLSMDEVVRVLTEGNRKTDQLIIAVKNPPKTAMVLQ